jgi:hypothetical protein
MPTHTALTKDEKAHLFDKMIATHLIEWRVGQRLIDGQMVERTYIEHGQNKDMLVVED